jgi:hypothetical protein
MMSDDMLVYPTDKVVGIVEERERVDALRDALEEANVGGDRIEVLCGEAGSERIDADGDEGGVFASALRTVQKALGEEGKRLEKLNDAVDAGKYVVQVAIVDGDDDEQQQDKQRIGRILHEGGAREVAFYGSWAVEEIQFGA